MTHTRSVAIPIALAGITLLVFGCVFTRYPAKAEIDFAFETTLENTKTLEVDTANGRITVRCNDGATKTSVSGTKHCRGLDDADAHAMAELIRFDVGPGDSANSLRIAAEFPEEARERSPGANLELVVPRDLNFSLTTRNGSIEIRDARGDVAIETSNGSITATAIDGTVNARTSNGRIRAEDIAGDVTLKSSNGKLTIENAGGAVNARTSNGKIIATGTRGAPRLETSNGTIEIRAASLPADSEVYARTSNGKIDAVLPRTVRAVLDMETSNARVHPELGDVEVKVLEKGKRHFRAEVGGGAGKPGGTIRLKASNGSVTCRLVDADG